MASKNERQRWDAWYTQVTKRMDRQKAALTRLSLMSVESIAALEEIKVLTADGDTDGAHERAQNALDRLAVMRVAGSGIPDNPAESIEEETPVEDPRK